MRANSLQQTDVPQLFSYTSRRDAFNGVIGVFSFLFLIETLLFALIIFIIHNDIIRLLLICGWLGLSLYTLFGFLLAPLRTKHQLTDTQFIVHYGLDKIVIPRNAIVSVQHVHEKLELFQNVRAQNQKNKQRIVACFSDHGQVLLQLDQLYTFKVDNVNQPVVRILINVDDRDSLLHALSVPAALTGQSIRPITHPTAVPLPTPQPTRISTHIDPIQVNSESSIRVQNLTRRYGAFTAVDQLNLAVRPGEIYGFLGANGAGKTTSMKMMVGLLRPTQGCAVINGHDVWSDPLAAKAAFGYVPDRALLYERLSGREFLAFLAQMRGISHSVAATHIDELLALLELADHAERPASAYSFGMKRKLALAGALLHQPPVLILDEPLNGLDPRSARRLKDLLVDLAAGGRTIFLSTHDLATAESICHRVGILHAGRLLAEGSTQDLRQLAAAPDLESVFLNLTATQLEHIA